MRLSTRGYYGLKAMYELARRFGTGPVPLKDIAQSQYVPENYLEQLLGALRRSGLVGSVRGAQGGYMLARDPGLICVSEIIRILEGPIAPVECVNNENPVKCSQADYCINRNVWAKVRDSIESVLDSITLADMCGEEEKTGRPRE